MRNDQEVRAKALELAIRALGGGRGLNSYEATILLKELSPKFANYISEGVIGDVPRNS